MNLETGGYWLSTGLKQPPHTLSLYSKDINTGIDHLVYPIDCGVDILPQLFQLVFRRLVALVLFIDELLETFYVILGF